MAATKMVTLLCTCLWLMLGCKAATVTTSYDLNVMTDMAELSTISATEEQIAKAACDKDKSTESKSLAETVAVKSALPLGDAKTPEEQIVETTRTMDMGILRQPRTAYEAVRLEMISLFQSNITTSSVSLDWDKAASGNVLYRLYQFSVGESSKWVMVYEGKSTSLDIIGLKAGQIYKFKVTAVQKDKIVVSAPLTTITESVAPGPISGLRLEAITSTSAKISWMPPVNDGGRAIAAYQVYVHSGESWRLAFETIERFAMLSALAPATTVKVMVVAVNSVGPRSFLLMLDTPTLQVTTRGGPASPVTHIKLVNKTSVSAFVTWRALLVQEGRYKVFVKSGLSSFVETCDTTEFHCNITNLKPAVKYTVKVNALNDYGMSGDGTKLALRTFALPPGRPRFIPAFAPTSTSVTLKWDAPDCDGGDPIMKYQVFMVNLAIAEAVPKLIYTGSTVVQSSVVTNLIPGTTYNFTVNAVNALGAGKPSVPASVKTNALVPSAVKLGTSSVTHNSTTLVWTPPENDYGAPVLMYRVFGINQRTGLMKFNVTVMAFPSTVVINGLHGNSPHLFSVAPINAVGIGPITTLAVTTAAVPPEMPDKVMIFDRKSDSLSISWMPPKNTGGSPIIGYEMQSRSSADGKNWYAWDHVEVLPLLPNKKFECEYTFESLKYAWNYNFRVLAVTEAGYGTPSDPVGTTAGGVAAGPVEYLKVVDISSEKIALEWTEPSHTGGLPIMGYRVSYRTTSDPYNLTVNEQSWTTETVLADLNSYTLADLQSGTEYNVKLQAQTDVGFGTSVSWVGSTAPIPAPPPAWVKCVKASSNFIQLAWEPAKLTGGAPITAYQVLAKQKFGNSRQMVEEDAWSPLYEGEALQATLLSLPRASMYAFVVRTKNAAGYSMNSNETICSTLEAVPGKATQLFAEKVDRTSVTLSWDIPIDQGGSGVKWYEVSMRSCSSAPAMRYVAMSNNVTINELAWATGYTFSVQAVNSVGLGEASTPIKVTTRAAVPAPPTTVVSLWSDFSSVSLRWSSPSDDGGSTISGYRVIANNGIIVATTGGTEQNTVVKHLNPTTNYTFTIKAMNAVGEGEPSKPIFVVTAATIPGAVFGFSVLQVSHSTVTLAWSPASNGGSAISDYVVMMKSSNGVWAQVYQGSGTEALIQGLIRKNTYSFMVSATNEVGNGPFSIPLLVDTEGTMPGAPTTLSVQDISDSSLILLWEEPADDGGMDIYEYHIVDSNSGERWTSMDTSFRLNMKSATNYKLSVAAQNVVGESIYSIPLEAKTLASCVVHPPVKDGDLSCTGNIQGASCNVECHDGFVLSGASNTTVCSVKSNWMPTLKCEKEFHLRVPVVVQQKYRSSGRSVFIFKTNGWSPLEQYDSFCESQGLKWFTPQSKQDAQLLLDTCDAYETEMPKTKWIIHKNSYERVSASGTIKNYALLGGYKVSVDASRCWEEELVVGHASKKCQVGELCASRKSACAIGFPSEWGRTSCWEAPTFDWIACESTI